MFFLKEDTAADIKLGPFVDKTDGVAYEVGMAAAMDSATTGVRLSKNGAAFADRNEATEPAYDAFGYYLVKLSTTDTNTPGTLKVIYGDAATTLPCEANFQVIAANAYDAMFGAGTVFLKVDVETVKTQTVTCGAAVTVLASVGTAATSTAQSGDSFPLVSTEVAEIYAAVITNAAGTDIAADIIAMKVDTAAILVDTGTTLDGRIPAALGADGFIKASVFGMMGTALTETAGQIAAAFTKFFNKAAPTGTVNSIPDAVAGAASGIAIVGSEMAANVTKVNGAAQTATLDTIKADVAGLAGAAMRGTDSAALASVCTEGRLSELDAITAGKMAYVADVIAVDVAGLDGAAMRGTDSAALASVCTEGRLAELDAANLPTDVTNVVKTTTTIADGDSLAANSLLLWIRRMRWMLNNKMAVVDATGGYTLYKDDGTTSAATGSVTDDSTTTTRSTPTWA